VLQRILPFLASMHAARGQKRPPTPSALTLDRPLAWHLACHVAALVLLAAATLVAAPALAGVLATAAALAGLAGALSFGTFFACCCGACSARAGAGTDRRLDMQQGQACWRRVFWYLLTIIGTGAAACLPAPAP